MAKKRVVNTKLCLNLLSQERMDTHALSQQLPSTFMRQHFISTTSVSM